MYVSWLRRPADPEHKALAHKADTMEKLSPTTFDAVPLKVEYLAGELARWANAWDVSTF